MINRTEYLIFAGQGEVGSISNKNKDNKISIIVHTYSSRWCWIEVASIVRLHAQTRLW